MCVEGPGLVVAGRIVGPGSARTRHIGPRLVTLPPTQAALSPVAVAVGPLGLEGPLSSQGEGGVQAAWGRVLPLASK